MIVCFCNIDQCSDCQDNPIRHIALFPAAHIGDIIRHAIIGGDVYYAIVVGTPMDKNIISWKKAESISELVKMDYNWKLNRKFRNILNPGLSKTYDFITFEEKTEYPEEILVEIIRNSTPNSSPNSSPSNETESIEETMSKSDYSDYEEEIID